MFIARKLKLVLAVDRVAAAVGSEVAVGAAVVGTSVSAAVGMVVIITVGSTEGGTVMEGAAVGLGLGLVVWRVLGLAVDGCAVSAAVGVVVVGVAVGALL